MKIYFCALSQDCKIPARFCAVNSRAEAAQFFCVPVASVYLLLNCICNSEFRPYHGKAIAIEDYCGQVFR